MRVQSSTRLAAMAVVFGALACAGNTAREADTDESAAARDTTTTDTLGADQNQPGYRGMETDTTVAPTGQQPSDTFLQNQGAGTPQDTAGYSGMERDTTGQAQGQTDTTGYGGADTAGYGVDTTGTPSPGYDTTSMTGQDTSGTKPSGDTTGYNPSQQPQDTASSQ